MSTVRRSMNLQRTKKVSVSRSSRIEALEARRVLAAPALGDLISEINIAAGAPVLLALDGTDADGDSLTYTVSSNNADIRASIPKQEAVDGHQSMRITVQGYGEMVFELFESLAPNTTSRIIEIAESGWYEGRDFHRVIDGFMIQGGSRDGGGVHGTGTKFDDEFHADLQFTTPGLLAMAKSGDDSNDSQFFITDVPSDGYGLPRWLDFNHTIFGKLTAGDDVREAISEANTNSSDQPSNDQGVRTPIVIESVEIFQDTQDAVMMIASPHGVFDSGEVTVTVSDGKGGTASKTIKVNSLLDNQNSNPFLGAIDPIWMNVDEPYSFQLDATDIEGDQIFYKVELLTDTEDIAVDVTDDGVVTITPKNEVVGVAEIAIRVGPTAASLVPNSLGQYQEAVIDTQIVTVAIPPAKPVVSFAPGSDTGAQDGSTARDNSEGKDLFFRVHRLQATSQLTVYLQGVEVSHEQITRIPEGDGSSSYVATIRLQAGGALDDGDYSLHVQQLLPLSSEFGGQNLVSELSDAFEFSVDTVAPVITSEAVDIAIQQEEYFYDVESDSEGDSGVYYKIQMPVPDGMVQDRDTGEIYWIPASDVGFEQPLVVEVIDGAGNKGRQEFSITVFAPLEIEVEGDQVVDELETVSLILTASDPSNLSSEFTITLQDGVLPSGADYTLEPLDANRARFTWNTTEADGPGVYDLVFGATNNSRAMSRETVRVSVEEVNEAPGFLEVFDNWAGTEDERIDLQFVAADGDLPANELVFDLFGDVPDGAEIDEASGLLSWTPDETDGGQTYQFGVRVTDSGGLSAEHMIVISVAENQKAPVFESTPAQRVTEGESLDFTVVAHDLDIPGRAIEYELEGEVPAGLSIDAQTGRVRWDVPETYLPDTTLETTFEVKVVAREVVSGSETALSSKQVVEITVIDNLAELVAATLAFVQTTTSETRPAQTAALQPLAGLPTDLLVSTTLENTPESDAGLPLFESVEESSFFGTQFGPTGAGGGGGGGGDGAGESEPGAETDADVPGELDETSSLERLLDEIAGDIGEGVIEALVAATEASADEVPTEQSVAEREPEAVPAGRATPSEEAEPEITAADASAQAMSEEAVAGESIDS